ncbi:hypothetical protein C8J56DRAFT_1030781 [Mycena floridula]|nr:hypothetical protein C8J56DRAFT_1030781 [Mycena floridula]
MTCDLSLQGNPRISNCLQTATVHSPEQVKTFHAEASPPHTYTTSSSIIPHSSPPKYLWVWQTLLNGSFPMLIKAFDLKYLERLIIHRVWVNFLKAKRTMWEMEALDLEDEDSGEDFQVMDTVTQVQ